MIRHEPVIDNNAFRTDSRGVTRNRYLTNYLNNFDVEILDQGHFIGNTNWNQFNVMSPFARIYYMIADSGWLETDQGRIDLLPGFMYLIPPNTRVNLRTDGRIEKLFFHVTWRYADTDMLDRINRCFVLPLEPGTLSQLLRSYQNSGPADLLRIRGIVYESLSLFISECLPEHKKYLELANQYSTLFAFVEKHLSADLKPGDICNGLGLSYETTRRRFRQDNGISLHQYIINRLIQKAGMMLLLTEMNVQQVALALGFDDEFYFSRLFKQKMTYSPREYRRINALLR
ncbi:MAG: helix-turn-helix transcriptional regulator [Saccharofermentanales bacterium]